MIADLRIDAPGSLAPVAVTFKIWSVTSYADLEMSLKLACIYIGVQT